MSYKNNLGIRKLEPQDEGASEEQLVEGDYIEQETCCHGHGLRKFILGIVVIAILWCLIPNFTPFKNLPAPFTVWPSNRWQAVFLTNDQVYFGKIERVGWNTVVIKDIYYLQVVNKPLQRTIEGQTDSSSNTQQELTLVKLGNELHGPTDQIRINRDQILFIEYLKNDGKVVQAINGYLESLKANTNPAPVNANINK